MDPAETLNIEQFEDLRRYLLRNGRIGVGAAPAFTRLPGGVSNRTVRVEGPDGHAFVLKQALPKLRVATDWFSDPRRIGQEALGLIWLERLAPAGAITPLLFQDPEQHLLAMQAVPLPHQNWKTQLLSGQLEQRHLEQFATLLAAIHRRSWEATASKSTGSRPIRRVGPRIPCAPSAESPIGVPGSDRPVQASLAPGADPAAAEHHTTPPRAPQDLADIFRDRSFFESLRLEPYYRFTATRHRATREFFDELVAETLARRLALTHGDYSPKNILVYEDRLVLLDHEVIHFGDPTFDLGFSLTHLLSKAHHLPARRRDFLAAARLYWETYRQAVGGLALTDGFESRAARHALGCLLARVDGRSPLEYLSSAECARQRVATLALIAQPPARIPDLIEAFGDRLATGSVQDKTSRCSKSKP